MRAKRIVSILLCFIFAVGMQFGAAVNGAEESDEQNILKLMENLEIVKPGFSVDLDKNVTRGEAVKYIVNTLIRSGAYMKGKTPYADVLATDDISSYINFAAGLGIISEAYNFHPDDTAKFEEVIKMITCGLGFDVVAQDNGGYPVGYTLAARTAKIESVKGMQIGDDVSYRQLFRLLKDTLTAKRCEKTYGAEEKWTITNNSLLTSVYDAEILKNAQVLSVDENKHTVTVKGNESLTLDLPANYQNEDMTDIFADIWYDKGEEKLLYFDILRSYQIRYDYISAVNGSEDAETEWYAGAVKSIHLYSDNKKYNIHTQDFKIRHNGIEDSKKSVKLVDTFARIVLKDGAVSAIESYDLTEGGFLTAITQTRVSFDQALFTECYIDRMDSTDSVRAILDGKRVDWVSLPKKCMIDYFQSDDMILIVASTYRVTGNLDAVRDGVLIISGERYNLNNQFGRVYYSVDNGVNYKVESDDLETMYNTEITAYLDMYGRVRYVSGVKNDRTLIGMVTHVERTAFGASSINIYADHNGTAGVKKFDVKLSKQSDVKEEDLLNLNNINDAVFKFGIRGKEIRYIENIDWLECNPAKKDEIKADVYGQIVKIYGEDRILEAKNDPHIFLSGYAFGRDAGLGRLTFQTFAPEDGAPAEMITNVNNTKFIMARDTLGSINPAIISWNDFKGCWPDRVFFKAGFTKDNKERTSPDIIYILSNPRYVYKTWDTFGVITEIENLPDDKYMLEVLEPDPKRTKYIVNGDEIIGEQDGKKPEKGDFVWLNVYGYYERVNYNALGEIISDEEAAELEESGDYVKKEETYQASGYARVSKTIDVINEVGPYDNENCVTYVDNIYSIEGSLMMYRDEEKGMLLPIRTKTVIRNQPYIVEGKNKYLMFDYEDFVDQRFETKSYDSLNTIKKSGFSDKLYIFSTGQGRYAKFVLRMPQDYERPGK